MSAREEEAIQRAIVDYLRLALPRHLVFAIPNGGLRSKREAARMKGQGVYAGVADLCVLGAVSAAAPALLSLPRSFVGFIEVKTRAGRLTIAQEAFRDDCADFGVPWACCRSTEEAEGAVRRWGLFPVASVRRVRP